jgi:rhomboid protease GluP
VISSQPRRRARFPIATLITTIITVACTVAQLRDPSVLENFRRNYDAAFAGEWWRWFTPMLVQSDGWNQILFNTATLIIVGVIAERRLGTLRWLVLYVGVGLLGEYIGQWNDRTGAGNSLAVCALVGALITLLLVRPGRATRAEIFVPPYYVACLAGLVFGGPVGTAVAASATCAILVALLMAFGPRRVVAFAAGAASIAASGWLALVTDGHGIALLNGAVVGLLLTIGLDSRRATAGAAVPAGAVRESSHSGPR